MDKEKYIAHRDIARHLGIKPGSILWLSADLTKLAFNALRMEGGFDTGTFIQGFQEQLGEEGTLLIPSFNFNLEDKSRYSRGRSIPITGALAIEAMKTGNFKRTSNPLHSFLVRGKETTSLTGLANESSFGPGSPFEFLHNYQAEMLIIGTSLSNAFTFVHYVEELQQVKYRKYKYINIFIEDENTWGSFRLFAKKPGWTMDMAGLEKILLEKKAAIITEINGISCTHIDLAAAFPVILDEIRYNRARNIARFSVKLYLRDATKQWLASMGLRTHSDKIGHDPGLL